MNSFKEAFDLAKRREIYQKESYLHPNKVAVVIEVHPKSKLALNRYFKFMANSTFNVRSVQEMIKKELIKANKIINPETFALYFFCSQKLLNANDLLSDLTKYRDTEDNFLPLLIVHPIRLKPFQSQNIYNTYDDQSWRVLGEARTNILARQKLHCFLPAPAGAAGTYDCANQDVIITNLSEAYQYSKWSAEEVAEAGRMSFVINSKMREIYNAQSTTLYVQVIDQKVWKKTVIHIIPRIQNDIPDNDQIYKMLDAFPRQLLATTSSPETQSNLQKACKKSEQFHKCIAKSI